MGKEYKAKVFKSGNSLALRLPKALGLSEGSTMLLSEEPGGYRLSPEPSDGQKLDLTGIYGSCPGLRPLRPADRILEERELDWGGEAGQA